MDRRFLVLNTHMFDLDSEDFWHVTVDMCLQLLQNQFFNGEDILKNSKIELQAYPGRAVFIRRENSTQEFAQHIDLANALMTRDISSRFISGISEEDYVKFFMGGQEKNMWRLFLCVKNAQLWHHLVVDKTVSIEQQN